MAFVTSTTRRNIHIPDEMDSDSFIVPDGYGFNLRDFSGACIDPTDDGASGMALGAMTCKYRGGSVRFVVNAHPMHGDTAAVLIPVEVSVRFTVAQLAILAGIDVTRASVISIDACDDDLVVYVNAARD